jgi:nitrogen-specific signal transduction histidine kinase
VTIHPDERPAAAAAVPDEALYEINRLWTIVRALASTAHDVNNALQVVAGSAELLEARDLEAPIRRRVEAIHAEATRAAAAIERLVAYLQADPRPSHAIDLSALVESAVTMRTSSAGRRRIVMSIERADANLPRARADSARTLQILLDLLLEAEARVVQRDDARIRVHVGCEPAGLAVTIAATAEPHAGVHEQHAERSSPLATAVTRDMQRWVARSLAAAQDGSVDAQESDAGVTFVLRLPAAS